MSASTKTQRKPVRGCDSSSLASPLLLSIRICLLRLGFPEYPKVLGATAWWAL